MMNLIYLSAGSPQPKLLSIKPGQCPESYISKNLLLVVNIHLQGRRNPAQFQLKIEFQALSSRGSHLVQSQFSH